MAVPCWVRVPGPLASYVEGFRTELERLGYTPLSAAVHVQLMAHLSRWLARKGLEGSALTQATVEEYFAERRAAGYVNLRTSRVLQPLVGYLRRLGVAPPPVAVVPATPVERLLARYRDYLTIERGLAETTGDLNVRTIRPFLVDRAERMECGLALERLTAGEVIAFVLAQYRQRPQSVKRVVTALRSLLRFLHVEGIISQSLATAVKFGRSQFGFILFLSAHRSSNLEKLLEIHSLAGTAISFGGQSLVDRPGLGSTGR